MEKLGKYCKIISGYAFKSNDLSEGTEIPVIKIGNISNGDDVITDSSTQYVSSDFLSIDEKYHIKKGDVLISLTGSHINQPNSMVGRSCRNFSDTEFLLNQRAGKVIPNENADKNYLYYLLNTESFKYSICNRAYGAANQANVSPSDIENIKWNFPPLRTQQKIASILSAYDNLIQNYKKQIEALQTAASELYKEWFVRFRFPGYKNSRFENGIPEGWKIERLGNLFEITSSKRVFEEDYVNEGIPFYRSKEIIELSNNQEITTELFISNELYAKFKNKFGVPKENDILITSVGSIGNSYQVRKDDIFYFKDGNLTWIKSSSKKALSKYLIYWLKSDLGKNTLISSTIGTSQSALTIEKLRAIKILVPEVNILEKFEQKISSFDIKIQILNKQIANLTQQRDLLLPRLMSGKLEV